jgi:hypothetical protein
MFEFNSTGQIVIARFWDLKLRELVKISGLDKKAPFHFMDCSAEYQSAHCCFITQHELENWLAGNLQPEDEFDEQELGIFLPDLYASDFYMQEERNNYISTLSYMRMINDMMEIEIEHYELVFAVFSILHEYGHWLHFRRCHKSNLDYVIWLNRSLAPVEQQREILKMIPDTEPMKEVLVAEHIDSYNAMPQEFSANKYALKHIKSLYMKILKHL